MFLINTNVKQGKNRRWLDDKSILNDKAEISMAVGCRGYKNYKGLWLIKPTRASNFNENKKQFHFKFFIEII